MRVDADFVELAQASGSAPAFERAALATLAREVGADVGFFATRGLEATPTVLELEPHVVAQLVAGGPVYERELRPVKRAALAGRGVAVDTDVLGSKRHDCAYFREVAALVGGRHSLLAVIRWRGQPAAGVMLGRTGAAFSERDVRRMEALLPALGVARAAFGLPRCATPLLVPAPSWRERLGLSRPPTLARVPTEDGSIIVRDRAGYREMVACNGVREVVWSRAFLADPTRSGWPYVELFHLAAGLARERRRALFIGAGGAVAVRQFARAYPGIALDVVECDPRVVALGREWFELDAIPGLSVHVADGARLVELAEPSSYDIVIVDAFDDRHVPPALVAPAFFRALRRALCPGGALGFNVIGTLGTTGVVAEVARGAAAEFDDVRLVPVVTVDEAYAPETLRNVVVVGVRSASE